MPDIVVYFAHAGKPSLTFIQQDPVAAHTNEILNWYFLSTDNKIKFAQVDFKDPNVDVFPGHTQVAQITGSGNGSMSGRVPPPAVAGTLATPVMNLEAYTIRALDQQQKEIAKYTVDPDVVTVDP
jgi:hypothetical protein